MPRLAADRMLGKLAKWLRILGFDTVYSNASDEDGLLAAARAEGRIILTRDTRFFRRISAPERAIFIGNDSFWHQIREVLSALDFLPPEEALFSRCSLCNEPLSELPRAQARDRVPEYVFRTQEHFTACPGCGRVYWSGTHLKMAKEMLKEIMFPPARNSEN